jgi:hypothetical protein
MSTTDSKEYGMENALIIFRSAAQDVMRSFQVKLIYVDEFQHACFGSTRSIFLTADDDWHYEIVGYFN